MSERDVDIAKIVLTPREIAIIDRFSKGDTHKKIAEVLKISHRTVGWHIGQVYKKTKCHNRIAITDFARQRGLIKSEEVGLPYLQDTSKDRTTFSNKKIVFFVLAMLLVNGVCLVVLIKLLLSFYKT